MKKLILLSITIFFLCSAFADIGVKSFRKLDHDLDALVNEKLLDDNNELCAIIKVVTTETGFYFDGGTMGIYKTVNKPAEIWVYVSRGIQRITITHEKLGKLIYNFPMPIEKATVYEMPLTTGRVITIVEENTIESQFLVITPEPANAFVYLNDEFVKTGEYQAKHTPDTYTCRVELPLYHTHVERFEITNERKVLNVKLKPAFGYIKIASQPESNAQVFVDGKLLQSNTPVTTEPIASGEHTVQVVKDMYQPFVQRITVKDGETTDLNAVLKPNFAELTVNAPSGASVVLNNQQKGTGNWSGRLSAGVYTIEARLQAHKPAKQDIELKAGDKRTITLEPTPIYGALDVMTSPSGASITINGKDFGTTPTTIKNLLIGEYTVNLSKAGYASLSRNITIAERTSAMISETLVNGREVTINSTPSAANLYIDGVLVGKTPYKGNLTFGNHILKIENEGKTSEQRVEIAQSGGKTDFNLAFGPVTFTEIIKGVKFDMIAIKGGTFMMGSPSSEKDRESDETQHQVTVSDFYMGQTEVTQELWEAVMGNNPSNFKGKTLPVEQVSWNDCQEFIKKLNQLTGKNYRLPTEAEWEYACRAGTTTPFNIGNCLSTSQANYDGNYPYSGCTKGIYRNKTMPVGSFTPNAWGLYDMHGNVWEWCGDWYGSYSSAAQTNPTGPSTGWRRVLRGGGWNSIASYCRSADCDSGGPDFRISSRGFRLVLLP
ncbi:hypothetical protein MASR2M117_20540 [Paludibacter sp.]